MKQRTTAVTLAIAALINAPAAVAADDDTRLFKDWSYGQHIDEFTRSQGYYDCSGDKRWRSI
jgi:hypothetical protein